MSIIDATTGEILAALTEPDRTRLLAIEQELRGDAAVKREVAS